MAETVAEVDELGVLMAQLGEVSALADALRKVEDFALTELIAAAPSLFAPNAGLPE